MCVSDLLLVASIPSSICHIDQGRRTSESFGNLLALLSLALFAMVEELPGVCRE